MLEDFVKWMASLTELERDQKMEILMNLFAPSPSHEDFKKLKGALKRKEKRVKQLESEIQKVREKCFQEIVEGVYNHPDYLEIKKRIIAAHLYRNLAKLNNALLCKNRELQTEIERLVSQINNAKEG